MDNKQYKDTAEKIRNTLKEVLPKKLKEYRNKSGYTTYDIGRIINKSQSTVAQWETGKTIPDIPTLLQLCQIYKIYNAGVFLELSDVIEPDENSTEINRSERELITLWRKSKQNVRSSVKILLTECNCK